MNRERFIEILDDLFRKTDIETFCDEEYDDFISFWNDFKNGKTEEKPLTELGQSILKYMKENKEQYFNAFTAKMIGEGLGINSRSASGALRTLVSRKYVEKTEGNPIVYKYIGE